MQRSKEMTKQVDWRRACWGGGSEGGGERRRWGGGGGGNGRRVVRHEWLSLDGNAIRADRVTLRHSPRAQCQGHRLPGGRKDNHQQSHGSCNIVPGSRGPTQC